jgi:hypothetical protein
MELNRMPRKVPRLSYSATVWENFMKNKGGLTLAQNLNQQNLVNLKAMIQAGSYVVQGLPGPETAPTTNGPSKSPPTMPSNFDLCRPLEKTLPILQTKLDEWKAVLTLVQPALEEVIRDHNATINPDGVPFKPNTRPATVPVHKLPGATAVRLPALPGQAPDLAALTAAGNLMECQVSNQPHDCILLLDYNFFSHLYFSCRSFANQVQDLGESEGGDLHLCVGRHNYP